MRTAVAAGGVDSHPAFVHYAAMRAVLAFGAVMLLAACSGGPGAYGITGPGPQPVAPVNPMADPDATAPPPGVPTTDSYYGSSIGPIPSSSGFFGYN
ncbi:MAG: hypothetical protein ACJ8AW_08450 [Rhodopila sp.]